MLWADLIKSFARLIKEWIQLTSLKKTKRAVKKNAGIPAFFRMGEGL
jgi:hypothetical protein